MLNGTRPVRRGLSGTHRRQVCGQPPCLERLPGFFFWVDLPRSKLRFCPVGLVVDIGAGEGVDGVLGLSVIVNS